MNPFEQVAVPRKSRSKFNLSYSKLLTMDMGQMIPVAAEEAVPGDHWQLASELVIRCQPLVAPILHPIYARVRWFFVPFRLLWDGWEEFITGGVAGNDASTLPRWTPTGGNVTNEDGTVVADNGVGSLWDMFGFPTGVVPLGALPEDFPRRAYNMVWNEFYRDQTQETEVDITTSSIIFNTCWGKDYFTSALPNPQRGTAPGMSLSGILAADFTGLTDTFHNIVPSGDHGTLVQAEDAAVGSDIKKQSGAAFVVGENLDVKVVGATLAPALTAHNAIDASDIVTFNLNDLRTMIAIQRFMELNARGGVRYVEWLYAQFGIAPNDSRLQRPQYIGGMQAPMIVSEVLQTSETTTGEGASPQGNLAGHGIVAGREDCGSFMVPEFGVILGILTVTPEAMYQQGVQRQWLRTSRYDFFNPLWVGLGEQAIQKGELYCTAVEAENETVFGYQGRYDEMRKKTNMVVGQMRSTFDYWHMSRQFSAQPALNETFLKCIPRKDVFAVPSEPGLIVHVGNIMYATRLLPVLAEPGFEGL